MKAISIRQPWASLIVSGVKPVENRTWKSNFRGRLLIHAAQKFDREGLDWICENCISDHYFIGEKSKELRGGIIGSVNMIDCVTDFDSDYFSGPYGFVFKDPINIPLKPWKGQLGFFEVPIAWTEDVIGEPCFERIER